MRTLGPCCCSIALSRMWRCSSFVGSCHRNGQPAMGPTKAPAGDPHFPRSSLRTPLPALNALCGWLRSPTELHTSQALENVGLETAGNGARGCLGWVFYWTWNLNLEPELELLLSQQRNRHTLRYPFYADAHIQVHDAVRPANMEVCALEPALHPRAVNTEARGYCF
jgi:hypothetical protein